jgi:hypothetical protein
MSSDVSLSAPRHKTYDVLTLDQRHFRLLAANDKPVSASPRR